MEERLVEERAEYLAERTLMEESVRGPNFDQGLVDELNKYGDRWNDEFKKRGMPTVPQVQPKDLLFDEMVRIKATDDWGELIRLASPFRLTAVRGELTVDHYFDVSILHDEYGYGTRRIGGNILNGNNGDPIVILTKAVIEMKKELGFGVNMGSSKKGKEVPTQLYKPQFPSCREHGNQLVAARSQKTGEDALRCPVVGCATILRKKRKSTLAG